jgi:hypothetical protein
MTPIEHGQSRKRRWLAAGVACALSVAAYAGDTARGAAGRAGTVDSEPASTATLHCEGMTGAQRDTCLRRAQEGERETARGATGGTPGTAGTDTVVPDSGSRGSEDMGSGRSDIGPGGESHRDSRTP